MGKIFVDVGMSLDGLIAGPNGRPGNPLGDGGMRIHEWLFGLASFRTPVFVLTHTPRDPWVRPGGTTFYFVTDGFDSALEQARRAAGDKDVRISGGAATIQQALRAGVVDELHVHIAPLLMGVGVRLFDGGRDLPALEIMTLRPSSQVTHLSYRVLR